MSCAERIGDAAGRTALAAVVAMCIAVAAAPGPAAAADLESLIAVPQRGQSAEQTRRDRYECHNWAVAQSGVTPARGRADEAADDARERRISKVITGAAVGALLGGLVRGSRAEPGRRGDGEAADGAIGGAVLGAAAGAIAGSAGNDDEGAEPAPEDDYLRALEACLAGRGYVLATAVGAVTR